MLLTGAAGFIGYHLAERLLAEGRAVVGIDNLNPYYSPALKHARLERLRRHPSFRFEKLDLADRDGVAALFAEVRPPVVVNLAAQAGVRYSLENPQAYIDSNLVGFGNILEGCRHHGCRHLVFASTSSVYGLNTSMPFDAHRSADHPKTIYAATKRANELMAHSYADLFGLPTTGLRFFTVYGPWGRPDMAMFLFAEAIMAGRPIPVFNEGRMKRDFTYVGDVVEGVRRVMERIPGGDPDWNAADPDPSSSSAPFRVYNIGNNAPVDLLHMIECLGRALDREVRMELLPMQPGDVPATYADVGDLVRDVGFKPSTSIEEGVQRFVDWYRRHHNLLERDARPS
ncbi:MAG: NAD-dependent epimerase [Geminicoccaceae bacterium]|nr:NAD-dependent epimerase [Geminicoccaceae bacterium]